MRNFSEKSYCYYKAIVYLLLTLTYSKYFVSYTIKLSYTASKRCSELGTRNRKQRIFRKVLPNHIHRENIDQSMNFFYSDETETRLPFYQSFSAFENVFGGLSAFHSSFLFMVMGKR